MAKSKIVNVGFAGTYEGCSVVANIMKLNTETVRKRTKAGKIPATQDKNGKWIFDHNALVSARVEPFASAGYISAPGSTFVPPAKKINYTDVIFVLDRSSSMSRLIDRARANLQDQLDILKKAAGPNDVYSVSAINFDDRIVTSVSNVDVNSVGRANDVYLAPYGNTRLYDGIKEALDLATSRDNGDRAFLISIVTDGEENASKNIGSQALAGLIKTANAKDRFTFVYAGPRGSEYVATSLGIPAGNVTTWEQTYQGSLDLGRVSSVSLNSYTTSRSAGVMSSTSFYAQPVTMNAGAFAAKLDDKLDDVTKSVTAKRVDPSDPKVIKTFCEQKFGNFEKGKYFYQLTESEKVQDYKEVLIQDNATGAFYAGWKSAKKLMGIPDFQGTVRIKPGNLGEFKFFVQSTSYNRKLVGGTTVVYKP